MSPLAHNPQSRELDFGDIRVSGSGKFVGGINEQNKYHIVDRSLHTYNHHNNGLQTLKRRKPAILDYIVPMPNNFSFVYAL
jgi:hypothetical protein